MMCIEITSHGQPRCSRHPFLRQALLSIFLTLLFAPPVFADEFDAMRKNLDAVWASALVGNHDSAVQLLARELAAAPQQAGENLVTLKDIRIAVYLRSADVEEHFGNQDKAEKEYQRAIDVYSEKGPEPHALSQWDVIGKLEYFYQRQKKCAKAISLAKNEMEMLQARDADKREQMPVLLGLGNCYIQTGDYKEARVKLEAALTLAKAYPEIPVETSDLYGAYARVLRNLNEVTLAAEISRDISAHAPVLKSHPPGKMFHIPYIRRVPDGVTPPEITNSSQCKTGMPDIEIPPVRFVSIAVWFDVDETGKVLQRKIVRPSGWLSLDDTALHGLSRCEFAPAILDGKPVHYSAINSYFWEFPFERRDEIYEH